MPIFSEMLPAPGANARAKLDNIRQIRAHSNKKKARKLEARAERRQQVNKKRKRKMNEAVALYLAGGAA